MLRWWLRRSFVARVFVATLAFVATVLAALTLLLLLRQDSMIFFPPRIDAQILSAAASEAGAQELRLRAEDGVQIYAWHWIPDRSQGRALLYFDGNASSLPSPHLPVDRLLASGWEVLVVDYRGYPGSEGRPSERGLRQDARAAWRFLTEERDLPGPRIAIHGRSLGGGVAVGLASEVEAGALVVEASFTSVADIAAARYPFLPVRVFLRHPFDSMSRAPDLSLPVLILHGDRDNTIPVSHGRALAASIEGARYLEIEGGRHDDLLEHESVMRSWQDFLTQSIP